MRKPVRVIHIAVVAGALAQHAGIVRQGLVVVLVVPDDPNVPRWGALSKPDSRGVIVPKIPVGIHWQTRIMRNHPNPTPLQRLLQFSGVHRASDARLEAALVLFL